MVPSPRAATPPGPGRLNEESRSSISINELVEFLTRESTPTVYEAATTTFGRGSLRAPVNAKMKGMKMEEREMKGLEGGQMKKAVAEAKLLNLKNLFWAN